MLNNTYIKSSSYTTPNQILFAIEHQVSVSIRVDDTYYDEVNGRKIVRAGTPLTGNVDVRTTAFQKSETNVKGILLHDVDVTDGENNGTMLVFGFVNTNRIDATTRALLTDDVKKQIPMIFFMKA